MSKSGFSVIEYGAQIVTQRREYVKLTTDNTVNEYNDGIYDELTGIISIESDGIYLVSANIELLLTKDDEGLLLFQKISDNRRFPDTTILSATVQFGKYSNNSVSLSSCLKLEGGCRYAFLISCSTNNWGNIMRGSNISVQQISQQILQKNNFSQNYRNQND